MCVTMRLEYVLKVFNHSKCNNYFKGKGYAISLIEKKIIQYGLL